MVVIGRSLLICSDVTFKKAAWWPYWILWFLDSNFSLALNINSKLKWHNTYIYIYIWVTAYWFSETSLSKWPPGGHIGYLGFRTLTLVWLWISTPNFSGTMLMYMVAILDFSVSGRHGFGSVTQICFGISVSNFMCMFLVAVGRSLMIVSYVAFKMAALWFWTMFNCNPPIAHCYPLLWGGGILVDHWSTISSYCHFFIRIPQKDSSKCNQIPYILLRAV